ncbi:hypothetical protein C1S81_15540 [Mycolicibacterium neoaurum]|nr:hypothetical protein C1S81_15540 [Mycolicibacterium neoaurum]
MNRILQRGGSVFELTDENRIRRNGCEETTTALGAIRAPTGNEGLDELIEQGRTMYMSHRPEERRLAMERLWDAFERLKTIEPGANKKAQIAALLSNIDSDAFRAVVDEDMTALTKIGNTFEIRHRETNTHPVPGDASDYLVGRMALVIGYLIHVRSMKRD